MSEYVGRPNRGRSRGAVIPAVILKDVWAWFAATPEEREAFRAEIAHAAAWGGGLPPDQLVIAVGSPLKLLVGLVWLGASLYLLRRTYPVAPLFLFSAMISACFTLAVLIDVIRQRLTRRHAGKS